jgi:hypothetical protein
MRFNVHLVNAF